jgi:hypothetical protein
MDSLPQTHIYTIVEVAYRHQLLLSCMYKSRKMRGHVYVC